MSAWPINPPSSGTLAFSLRLAPYCRSCPCDRHDLYLPSIPASLQTLGRCECVATCALAPLGLRIISPLTFYLSFLGAIWTYDKKFGSDLSLPAADSPAFHTGSSASPSLAHSQFPGTSSATLPPYRLLRHSGFLTSPHAFPACNKRSFTSLRLLLSFTDHPPVAWAHLLQLPTAPRLLLCTSTVTN